MERIIPCTDCAEKTLDVEQLGAIRAEIGRAHV